MRSRVRNGIILGLLALALLPACRKPLAAKPAEAAQPGAIHKSWPRGPVTLFLDVSRSELTIADRVTLTLALDAPEGMEVELPAFGEKLDQFAIVGYRTPTPQLQAGGKMRHQKVYDLEPFLSGEYRLQPMTVKFKEKTETDWHEVATEELTLKVASVIPEGGKLELHDIAGPMLSPRPIPWVWLGVGGGAVLALGLLTGLLLWLRRRKNGPAAEPPIDPAELAYDALRILVAEELVGKGEIKQFYLGLSGILRHYIENRFHLNAPEHTTEEFLRDLRDVAVLAESHKALLRQFLQHCDLVKFAEHQPQPADIQATFDTCKRFIEETREVAHAV